MSIGSELNGIQLLFFATAAASVVLLLGSALHARLRWQLLTAAAVPLWIAGLLSLFTVGWLILVVAAACAVVGLRRQSRRAGA